MTAKKSSQKAGTGKRLRSAVHCGGKGTLYSTSIRIFYPLKTGTIILRTENNWRRDIEATCIDKARHRYEFQISHRRSILSFKPCIRDGGKLAWAGGTDKLAIMDNDLPQDFYPYFFSGFNGTITEVEAIRSNVFKKRRLFRVYLPAGYEENPLKHYPVLYMHDGKNLFFPQEAFLGQDWEVDDTLDLLDAMSIIEQTIVVGVYSGDREYEYTSPGYEKYGEFVVGELKPAIDRAYRTLRDPEYTAVMGSSLGGVVSFYLAWHYPQVFGLAACLSSTFTWKDDLVRCVERDPLEPRSHIKFYLDSGWPGDNYKETVQMAATLLERGFRLGRDFVHLAFPLAIHSETAWSSRFHIPMQMFAGKLRRANLHHMK